jgi:hypothetical protein
MLFEEEFHCIITHLLLVLSTFYHNLRGLDSQVKTVKCGIEFVFSVAFTTSAARSPGGIACLGTCWLRRRR